MFVNVSVHDSSKFSKAKHWRSLLMLSLQRISASVNFGGDFWGCGRWIQVVRWSDASCWCANRRRSRYVENATGLHSAACITTYWCDCFTIAQSTERDWCWPLNVPTKCRWVRRLTSGLQSRTRLRHSSMTSQTRPSCIQRPVPSSDRTQFRESVSALLHATHHETAGGGKLSR